MPTAIDHDIQRGCESRWLRYPLSSSVAALSRILPFFGIPSNCKIPVTIFRVPRSCPAWLPPDRLSSLFLYPIPPNLPLNSLFLVSHSTADPIPPFHRRCSPPDQIRAQFLRGPGFPRLGYSLAFCSISDTCDIGISSRSERNPICHFAGSQSIICVGWRAATSASVHTHSAHLLNFRPISSDPATNITPFLGLSQSPPAAISPASSTSLAQYAT